jgi:hypothetical protein
MVVNYLQDFFRTASLKALETVANHGFPPYWRGLKQYAAIMTQLKVDRIDETRRHASLTLQLEGELSPIHLEVRYRVYRTTQRLFVESATASRPWLEKLAKQAMRDFGRQGFLLPESIVRTLLEVTGIT